MIRSWGVLALVLLCIGAALGAYTAQERKQLTRAEQERLSAVVNILDANVSDELKSVSVMLEAVRDDIPGLWELPDGLQRLNHRLALVSKAVPVVRTMVYVDANGDLLASSVPELIGKNFKGSERYQAIKIGQNPKAIYISPPYTTPMGNYTVSVGKVLLDRKGQFAGYLLAVLDPVFFMNRMRSLLYASDMRISIAHGDGKVVYSTQSEPDIRGVDLHAVADSPFSEHMASGRQGSFITHRATVSDTNTRYIALRTINPNNIADKVLVVAGSRDTTAVLAPWRRHALERTLIFVATLVAAILVQLMLSRRQHAISALREAKQQQEIRAQHELNESNARFRGYFQNMAVGAVQLGADGCYELANDRYCEMTGYTREELLGGMHPADITHPDDVEREKALFTEFWTNPNVDLDLEKRMVTKGGAVIWVHVTAHGVRNADGTMKFTTGVIEDVTGRKKLISDLEEAKLAAEEASRAKSLFLGKISHEMRTPLHQITGFASLFRRDVLSDKQTQRLSLLETASKRLESVISSILTLVNLESGTTSLKLRPVSLQKLKNETIAMFGERAAKKQLILQSDDVPLPEPLLGDANHLRTILSSYIDNAITYSEQGIVKVNISCVREDSGSALIRIAVSDEGKGIAPEHLTRLFTNFEQVDNSFTRQYGGTGVGLSIVKKLAKLMGGDAGCESDVGRGSTFWVTLLMPKQFSEEDGSVCEVPDKHDFQI